MTFAHRTVNISCLTEAAAADTAAEHLQHYAVMNNFAVWYNYIFRRRSFVKVRHNTLCDSRFCRRIIRRDAFYGAVVVILYVVK